MALFLSECLCYPDLVLENRTIEDNQKLSFDYLEKAAQKNIPYALYRLANHYQSLVSDDPEIYKKTAQLWKWLWQSPEDIIGINILKNEAVSNMIALSKKWEKKVHEKVFSQDLEFNYDGVMVLAENDFEQALRLFAAGQEIQKDPILKGPVYSLLHDLAQKGQGGLLRIISVYV